MATPGAYLFPISERVAFLSRVHIGTTISLLALCLIPFFARIYIRVWPVWRFGWDDAFIVAGLVCFPCTHTSLDFSLAQNRN